MVIEKSQGHRLEWAAENQVAYSDDGRVVVMKEKAQNTRALHTYNMEFDMLSDEIIYQKRWNEDLPHGINPASVIAGYGWTDGYRFLLEDKSTSTTLLLCPRGRELVGSWHHEGILLTCLKNAKLVFSVEKRSGEYEIVIVDTCNENKLESLQPITSKPTWSHPYLSVCEGEGRIAVTSKHHTLDIYYWDGR